jgi:predicted nucleic acid-binding protein
VRIALDTNVIVYAIGIDGSQRQAQALDIIDSIPARDIVLPAQVLAELFRVLAGKVRLSREESALVTLHWGSRYEVEGTNVNATMQSLRLAASHHITIWDALVLATAAEANCQLLLSEDMQHGFTWSGVTVVNPFTDLMHPLLELALGGESI